MEIGRNRCNGSYGNQYLQILEVSYGNYNVETNTTPITITYTNRNDAGTYGNFGYANPATIYIADFDGQRSQSFSNSYTDYRNGAVVTLGTWSTNVKHYKDGKLTLSVWASFSSSSSSLSGGSVSGTIALPDIPRQAKITEAPNFNDEQNPTIKYSNPASSVVTELKACISLTGARDDVPYRDVPINGNSYTFNLTNEERETLRNATPNNNNLSVTFFLRTKIGSTILFSTVQRTMSIINGNPVFSDFEFEDINSTTIALTGDNTVNVKGYSNIKATIPVINKATAVKSATMSKYRFVIDTQTVDITYSDSQEVNGTINNAMIGTYNLYAIDSRNNSTLVTKLATSNIEYEPVSFNTSSCKVERINGGVGAYAELTLSGYIWNNNFGQVSNSIKNIYYQYKKTSEGESAWQTGPTTITPTISGNSFSFTGQVGSNDTSDNNKFELQTSYNFRIYIEDELSTKLIELTPMSSAVPNISLADDGVGIMCDYDDYLGGELQVGGLPLRKYPRDVDYCVATISSTQTASSNYRVLLNSIDTTDSSMFSLNNGNIIIGQNVNTIRISASIFIQDLPANNYVWGKLILNNSNNQAKQIITSISNGFDSGPAYASVVITERFLEVEQGDIINLIADGPLGGTIRSNNTQTWVQIEKIN